LPAGNRTNDRAAVAVAAAGTTAYVGLSDGQVVQVDMPTGTIENRAVIGATADDAERRRTGAARSGRIIATRIAMRLTGEGIATLQATTTTVVLPFDLAP
jgi:hypothetical protein